MQIIVHYVDGVVLMRDTTKTTMTGIQVKFQFKNDQIDELYAHLGATIPKIFNQDNVEC